jgi:xylulokinase
MLFDLEQKTWSPVLLAASGLDADKLPFPIPSGTPIGRVDGQVAAELGLPAGAQIVSGAHDQCANAVGCGVIHDGQAVYGMGTYHCITPVYSQRLNLAAMMANGLNTEHHAVPEKYVSFIYNQGGSLVKWYRDTFARQEHRQAQSVGQDIYAALISEIPDGPSGIFVLPHFAITGPPEFIDDSCGMILGLRLETPRGAILKGLMECTTFYLKEVVERLPQTGIYIQDYRVSGGGSKSDAWIQTCADILGQPFTRPMVIEAGCLGAALLAGVGVRCFSSFEEGVTSMIALDRTFEPDPMRVAQYQAQFEKYIQLWPLMRPFIKGIKENLPA